MLKSIQLSILEPKITPILSDEFTMHVKDDANIFDILAEADRILMEKISGDFPIKHVKSLFQLFWNPISDIKESNQTEGSFYGDIAIDARDAENKWLRIRKYPYLNVPSGSRFVLVPDAGC